MNIWPFNKKENRLKKTFIPANSKKNPPQYVVSSAQNLATQLPDLLLSAERIANTVIAGEHGYRRVGRGNQFWQYRLAIPGESNQHIDWRRSAKSDRTYIREIEDEVSQTANLWCDHSPSMLWRSSSDLPTKQDRALLLSIALSYLLLNSGERIRLPFSAQQIENFSSPQQFVPLAFSLLRSTEKTCTSLPKAEAFSPYTWCIFISDFLYPYQSIEPMFQHLIQRPNRVLFLSIYDPAERFLPYKGQLQFVGLEEEETVTLSNVESLAKTYQSRWTDHYHKLEDLCTKTGNIFLCHRTDQPPAEILLHLWNSLSHQEKSA